MEKLFGKTLEQLSEVVKNAGLPAFTAKQMADWLYKKNVSSIDDMLNLSKKARELLSQNFEVGRSAHVQRKVSKDGTKKYLFTVDGNKSIESAYIPDEDRATLCLSTQVGCKMGCLFCMTGKQGFQGNLTVNEILNQYASLPEKDSITNFVYMGMGEPFDNLDNVMQSLELFTADYAYGMSPKRITVSTIGILPAMKHFLEHSKCHLAVSMHSPFDEERKRLMPIQSVYTINEIVQELRLHDFNQQHRLSFEYIVFKGINDSENHVKEIIRLLKDMDCRVNLIRFHPIPGTPLEGVSDDQMMQIRNSLTKGGVFTTLRQSRGQDIYAACGLLSTKANRGE